MKAKRPQLRKKFNNLMNQLYKMNVGLWAKFELADGLPFHKWLETYSIFQRGKYCAFIVKSSFSCYTSHELIHIDSLTVSYQRSKLFIREIIATFWYCWLMNEEANIIIICKLAIFHLFVIFYFVATQLVVFSNKSFIFIENWQLKIIRYKTKILQQIRNMECVAVK